ncbi:MAG TPA: hypothetical protein VK995_03790, partial [Oceanipulchritudo sp.]|nr:hypothetical protein [Oceanipulchritudo sp.]
LAGVTEVGRFTQLSPSVTRETASWDADGGMASGDNFGLSAGNFIWVRFEESVALELGNADNSAISLSAGLNVISFTGFPSEYSAYELVESVGTANVFAVRMLDSRAGLWHGVVVDSARILGPNFRIPTTAVLIIEMNEAVPDWNPRR